MMHGGPTSIDHRQIHLLKIDRSRYYACFMLQSFSRRSRSHRKPAKHARTQQARLITLYRSIYQSHRSDHHWSMTGGDEEAGGVAAATVTAALHHHHHPEQLEEEEENEEIVLLRAHPLHAGVHRPIINQLPPTRPKPPRHNNPYQRPCPRPLLLLLAGVGAGLCLALRGMAWSSSSSASGASTEIGGMLCVTMMRGVWLARPCRFINPHAHPPTHPFQTPAAAALASLLLTNRHSNNRSRR